MYYKYKLISMARSWLPCVHQVPYKGQSLLTLCFTKLKGRKTMTELLMTQLASTSHSQTLRKELRNHSELNPHRNRDVLDLK